MTDKLFSIIVILAVLVVWVVVVFNAIKIYLRRDKILKRMREINSEMAEINGKFSVDLDIETLIDMAQRMETLDVEFQNLTAEFEGRK